MYVNYLSNNPINPPPMLPDPPNQTNPKLFVFCVERGSEREFCYVFLPSELAPK